MHHKRWSPSEILVDDVGRYLNKVKSQQLNKIKRLSIISVFYENTAITKTARSYSKSSCEKTRMNWILLLLLLLLLLLYFKYHHLGISRELYDPLFDSRHVKESFLFSKTFRLALGSIQAIIRWLPEVLPLDVKRSGCGINHSSPSSAEDKNEWSYTSTSPVCCHGLRRDNLPLSFAKEFQEFLYLYYK